MIRLCLSAALLLAMTGPVLAQTLSPGSTMGAPALAPTVAPPAPLGAQMGGSSVPTSGGPALVTGTAGAAQTIMVPGSPTGGWLTNNGNGTSTVVIPGGVPQLVPTPR